MPTMKEESRRHKFEILRAQLEQERSSFLPIWRDCGDFILPRRPRFFTSDVNRGDRRNQKIIDGTATYAARTLRSGMMSGITSPARPWFRLATPDPEMMDYGPVKDWLHTVSTRMVTAFLRSNLYNVLPILYGDLGVFGTGALSIEADMDKVFRFFPFSIGSYMIANDFKLQVDTFIRDFRMTVRQIIQRFGVKDERTGRARWDNFSSHVKTLYDNSNYEAWIDITHVVRPNELFDVKKLDSKYKRFTSCYYERGSSRSSSSYMTAAEDGIMLSEKGYDYFPILAPRWETTGEDTYGTSWPAVDAMGDIKALQTMQKRKAQAVEKMVNPPMQGPTLLRTVKSSILPGDITYYDESSDKRGLRPIHEVNPRVNELLMDIQDGRQMIRRAFFEDLFLMLAQSDRRSITAREIDERHEEKLLALGPVLEQLNQDLLDPLIDNAFKIMIEMDMIPPPPEELSGVELKVEYISIMAQAQKMVGLSGIERFFGFVSQAAQFDPSVLKKVDINQGIDLVADMLSVPPSLVRSNDDVEKLKQQEQAAMAQQQQMMAMQQTAQTAKTLSETDTGGSNALTALIGTDAAG